MHAFTMRRVRAAGWGVLLGLCGWVTASVASAAADPLDWPNWRGPEQNRVSREKGLVDQFDPYGEKPVNLLWKNPEAAGISTPIVLRGKLYTTVRHLPGTKQEQEKVICLDAATGKKIWENKFNVFLSDVPKERVGWSHCVGDPDTGRIFVQGVCGYFQCLDGETGKTIWSRSMHEEFGAVTTYGGRTNTPVIFEDLVLISAVFTNWGENAVPAHRFMAFDKNTGEVRWFAGTKLRPEDTTYSTPTLTVFNGQAAMVFGSGDGGVYAFQPRTGKKIWGYQLSKRGLNAAPIVVGNAVFMGNGEENSDDLATFGSFVAIDGSKTGDITKTGTLWKFPGLADGKSTPIVFDGRVYAIDDSAKLTILDAKTGAQVGRRVTLTGTIMRGSPLYADGKFYVCTTSAWHVFQVTADGLKVLQQKRLDSADEVSGSPIVSHGRIYLPTMSALYCIGKADQKPTADPLPADPKQTAMSAADKPTQLQILPAELLMSTGQQQKFRGRVFNERGQMLKDNVEVKFTLDGPGTISADGTYSSPTGTAHTATIIKAEYQGVTSMARVRVVPPLPWSFEFTDVPLTGDKKLGEPPVTWVGARHRHVVRELDGERVMVKVNTIPKGTRSQAWMGPIDLHDYTIQADVRGSLSAGEKPQLPDMGLIAQRYTLDLMGEHQKLQIRSWTPETETRFSKDAPFEWKAGTWYTLKFKASVITEGGATKALLQGKAWPRGETEPAKWMVEAVDATPNVIGSPGLFGNANYAEFYINHITVVPNEPAKSGAE